MSARVTAAEVARAAGVSRSAVSRTFTPGSSVSTSTRNRIEAVAARLGYRPNALARTLITRRSRIIGVVMAAIDNPFHAQLLQCLDAALQARGLAMLLRGAARPEMTDELIHHLLSYQVDGVIVASGLFSSSAAKACVGVATPVVMLDRLMRAAGASAVGSDNRAGARMAAEHLVALGRRRIAFMSGTPGISTSSERAHGFLDGLAEAGLAPIAIASGRYEYAAGQGAAEALLAHAPDAIFCENDLMAMAVLDVARARGVRVPDDLAVIGFDDIPAAALPAYALTTVAQDARAMADAAAALLEERIEKPARRASRRLIACTLVRRRSA
ncbi:LacI family DNA-binding transcriptional regulator [Elioraea sp.]|uniref:LacI family DNA-binding transcriptional regulator n=1 Tax=Elioraea sp. TaxID=2185103 RepID=UPI0025C17A45|nr:LacI family DNA-binding transcriptional regulator [Elioraea sp.]